VSEQRRCFCPNAATRDGNLALASWPLCGDSSKWRPRMAGRPRLRSTRAAKAGQTSAGSRILRSHKRASGASGHLANARLEAVAGHRSRCRSRSGDGHHPRAQSRATGAARRQSLRRDSSRWPASCLLMAVSMTQAPRTRARERHAKGGRESPDSCSQHSAASVVRSGARRLGRFHVTP